MLKQSSDDEKDDDFVPMAVEPKKEQCVNYESILSTWIQYHTPHPKQLAWT